MSDEVISTTVDVVGSYDVVAILKDVLQSVGNGGSARSDSQTSYTTLEGSHTVFEYTLSRVGQATIDITCVTESESIGSVLRVAEHITCGLVDRHRTCVGSWIWVFLTYMQLKCLKAKFLFCTHNLCPFFNFTLIFNLIHLYKLSPRNQIDVLSKRHSDVLLKVIRLFVLIDAAKVRRFLGF